MDQLTIFDYLPSSYDVAAMTTGEIASVIGDMLDLPFEKVPGDKYTIEEEYAVKIKNITYSIGKNKFSVPPYTWYISCGWQKNGGNYAGASAPIDTVDEAVRWFRKALEKNGKTK